MEIYKQLKYLTQIKKNEFADILEHENKELGNNLFFKRLLYDAIVSKTLIPQDSTWPYIDTENHNFTFNIVDAAKWANDKGFKLPDELIERIGVKSANVNQTANIHSDNPPFSGLIREDHLTKELEHQVAFHYAKCEIAIFQYHQFLKKQILLTQEECACVFFGAINKNDVSNEALDLFDQIMNDITKAIALGDIKCCEKDKTLIYKDSFVHWAVTQPRVHNELKKYLCENTVELICELLGHKDEDNGTTFVDLKKPEINSSAKCNKFDWDNFYNEENAKIIEHLLDKKETSMQELAQIFFPRKKQFPSDPQNYDPELKTSHENIIIFLKDIFNELIKKPGAADFVLINPVDKDHPLTENTLVIAEFALSQLIDEYFLPLEIRRLPRFTNEQMGFEIIPDYYPQYNIHIDSEDQIIKSQENYSIEEPMFISYEKLKMRWKEKADNFIVKKCYERKLTPYLKIPKKIINSKQGLPYSRDCVITSNQSRMGHNSLSLYRASNCGNPFYKKRYEGYEQLALKDSNYFFDLITLFRQGFLELNSPILNYLATTDLETKLHFERKLVSFNSKQKIELNDLFFLDEEVNKCLEDTENFETGKSKPHNGRLAREEEIATFIERFINIGKQKGYQIKKDKMPGTKNEMVQLMKKKKIAHHLSNDTLHDYFKRMGIGFMRGSKKNKCIIFNQISQEILSAN